MKFTFILGYRHQKDRLTNLKRTLEWMYSFKDSEIILVEQDKYSKIKEYNFFVKHIFLDSDQPYNRSWSFNVGLKYATTDIVVFTDSDIIVENNHFLDSLELVKEYNVVSPYNSVIDLNPKESKLPYNQIFSIKREGRGELDNQKINLCGGMVIFDKNSIKLIGGWSENFISWGGEDDYQTIKVEHFLTYKELIGKCYHLYHEKQKIDKDLYSNNLNFLSKVKKYTKDDLIKEINKSYKNNGRKNKYC